MAVNHSKLDEWELFVPKWEGQREAYAAGDDDAVTMELRLISKEARDRYGRDQEKMARTGAVNAANRKMARSMVADNVRSIENYTVDDVPITDGGELYDLPGLDDLLLEVVTAITTRSSLEVGLAKKLRSRSATTPAERPSKGNGVAADVIPTSTPTTLEARTTASTGSPTA